MAAGLVSIDPHDRTPIYAQLDRGLGAAGATGRLQVGDQLPTVRQLAVELSINANTVARVYAELERGGIIETRRGVGSFVVATPQQAHPGPSSSVACVRHSRAADAAAAVPLERCAAEMSAHRSQNAVLYPRSSYRVPPRRCRYQHRRDSIAVSVGIGIC